MFPGHCKGLCFDTFHVPFQRSFFDFPNWAMSHRSRIDSRTPFNSKRKKRKDDKLTLNFLFGPYGDC